MSDTKTKSLARQFAANLLECERRNDFGGLHAQARRDLSETIYTHTPRTGYRLPNGRVTTDFRKAVDAWGAV